MVPVYGVMSYYWHGLDFPKSCDCWFTRANNHGMNLPARLCTGNRSSPILQWSYRFTLPNRALPHAETWAEAITTARCER